MSAVNQVESALRAAGDPELVHLWRRTCRELAVGPRLAVVGLTAAEAARALPTLQGLGAAALGLDPSPDATDLDGAIRDPLLGVHGVLWVTSAAQPLGERERAALSLILREAKPGRAAVLLQRTDLLARLSDDPETERAQILDRLRALVPEGVQVLDESELDSYLGEILARHAALTRDRQHAVAEILLDQAGEQIASTLAEAQAAVDRNASALSEEDAALDEARRAGQRAATYTLGVATRHTEAVRSGVRDLMLALEADLPAQIQALDDVELTRRVLPHWIEHVVRADLQDRVSSWRAAVRADLDRVPASDRALAHAELLMPAVHPSPFPVQGRWRRAVGLTAGVGGAVLLASLQLWIPAALAAAGGLTWSVVDRDPATARQDRLVEQARTAVRALARDIDQVLAQQLEGFKTSLAELGTAEADRVAADRAEIRSALTARKRLHEARLEQARAAAETFERQRQALRPQESP